MDIDVFQLPGIVRKRLHYVVLAALTCAVLALGFVVTQKPFYRATAELFVDIGRGPGGTDTGGALSMQQLLGSQLYLIQSRDVLRDLVQKLDLVKDSYFNRPPGPLSRLLGRTGSESDATDGVIDALLENIFVERNGDSFVFTITVKHGNSGMAAKIANGLAESYLRIAEKARLDVSVRTTRTIAEQTEELRKRVLDAQAAVETFRSDNGLISVGDQGLITDQQLSGLNQQLLAARQQVEQQRTIYDQARQLNVSNVEAGAIPETLNSEALSALRSRYAQALDRQAELSANLGNGHPQIRAVRSQIASIRDAIEKELGRIRQLTANTYERAKTNLASLEKRFDTQADSIKDNGKVRFQLAQLASEAQAIDAVYKAFLTRAEELSRQQDLASGNSRIISEAVPSEKPVQAPKMLVVLAAILFGAAAGASLAVVRELFGGVTRLERTLMAKTGAPVLAVMQGDAPQNDGSGLSERLARLIPVPLRSAQEAMPRTTGMRRLAQVLRAEFGATRPATIAVLSPDGSGKDGVAADLAHEMALLGEEVVFSGGELRRMTQPQPAVRIRSEGATALYDAYPRSRAHTIEDILHFDRIGSGILRKISVLSSSRVSTALRLEPPDFCIVDCGDTPARAVLPTVLKHADGIVIVAAAGVTDGGALDALMGDIGPWRDRLVGNVLICGRNA